MNPATIAFVGLGGNVGDAAATLREALAVLDGLPGTRVLRASTLSRTPAWGPVEQPDFVNAAAKLETDPAPRARLERKSVAKGKSVSVRVDLGGRVLIKEKNKIT